MLSRVDQYLVADKFQSSFLYLFFFQDLTENISR